MGGNSERKMLPETVPMASFYLFCATALNWQGSRDRMGEDVGVVYVLRAQQSMATVINNGSYCKNSLTSMPFPQSHDPQCVDLALISSHAEQLYLLLSSVSLFILKYLPLFPLNPFSSAPVMIFVKHNSGSHISQLKCFTVFHVHRSMVQTCQCTAQRSDSCRLLQHLPEAPTPIMFSGILP